MKRPHFLVNLALLVSVAVFTFPAAAHEKRFLDTVGPGNAGPVAQGASLQVPYITWGGNMATFYANGGLETKAGTIFQKQGLNLKLTAGDDFVQQVNRRSRKGWVILLLDYSTI